MNANAAELAPQRAVSRRAGTLETLAWCARRELWEHRALWIAPLVVVAVLAAGLLIGEINMDLPTPEGLATERLRGAILTLVMWALAQPVFFVTSIVVTFYLLDALYAERKDRSILFWKSLPVSDELTVGSKFAVATLVVPLGAFLLASVSGLVFAAIVAMRVPGVIGWNTYEWLRTELVLLLEVALGVLWYSPVVGALLLCSSWVRKGPIVWATLVVFVAPIAELVGSHTHYIWNFERYRMSGIWHTLGAGHEHLFEHLLNMPPVGAALDNFNVRAAFTDLDLWVGVIAAAALAYAAARIRRYRDDT